MLKPKVVFFGSGPVAAKSLELLVENFDVEAVVTKPKPEHHRGDFPVLTLVEKLGLPIKTVQNKAELSTLIASKPFTSKVGVLIDFGIIVTRDVIDYFPKGIVNSHFSLLPQWRGADPITFSILSGQEKTGVSLMLLVEKMDEGPLLGFGVHDIIQGTTSYHLTHDLIQLSDALLRDVLPGYINGTPMPQTGIAIVARSQEEISKMRGITFKPTYSRKLTKEDGRIDWNKPAAQIEREINAFIEWPKSYTTLAGKDVVITKAYTAPLGFSEKPGDIQVIKPEGVLMINCGEDTLVIEKLKPAGKNEMTAAEFIRGYGKDL